MPDYLYEARDKEGKQIKGIIETDSAESVRRRIEELGYVIVSIKEHKRRREPDVVWAEKTLARLFPESQIEARWERHLIESLSLVDRKLFQDNSFARLRRCGLVILLIAMLIGFARNDIPILITSAVSLAIGFIASVLFVSSSPIEADLRRLNRCGRLQDLRLSGITSRDLFWMLWRENFRTMLLRAQGWLLLWAFALLPIITLMGISSIHAGSDELALATLIAATCMSSVFGSYNLYSFLASIHEELHPLRLRTGILRDVPSAVRIAFARLGYFLIQTAIAMLGVYFSLILSNGLQWIMIVGITLALSLLSSAWHIRHVYVLLKSNYADWFDEKITEIIESEIRN